MINMYFDETNHTRKIGTSNKGDSLTFKKGEEYYSYFFISYADEEVTTKRIEKLERDFFGNHGEVKGKRLTRRSNFYEMNKKNKNFYIELLKIVKDQKKYMQYGSINVNYTIMHRILVKYCKLNGLTLHSSLLVGITKLINNNSSFEFYDSINNNSTYHDVLNYLINLLNTKIIILEKVKNGNILISTFTEYKILLTQLIENGADSKLDINWEFDYDAITTGLHLLSREKEQKFRAIVDNEKGIFNALSKEFEVEGVISEDSPLIRVSDYLASLLRRIGITLRNNHTSSEIDSNFKMNNPYNRALFSIDAKSMDLLNLCFEIFDYNTYYETFASGFNDELIQLIAYLDLSKQPGYFNSISLNNNVVSRLQRDWEMLEKQMKNNRNHMPK